MEVIGLLRVDWKARLRLTERTESWVGKAVEVDVPYYASAIFI